MIASMVRAIAPGLLVSPIVACSEPILCTGDIRPAVEIEVLDRSSGEFIPSVARGVVQEGPYQDSLQPYSWTGQDPAVAVTYVAAFERIGIYQVHLEVEGYLPWDTSGIVVGRDECHVRTASFTAALDPT